MHKPRSYVFAVARCTPQIRDHIRSFLLGSVAALSVGYYRVHQDLWTSQAQVSGHLEKLGEETVRSQVTLQQRVEALEAEVTKLKEKANS